MRNAVMLAVCTLPIVAWASPEEVSVPTLSRDVLAVEVEIDAKDRRYTRDAAAVTSVLDALGSADAWAASGMPRCMPRLWARLTPRSGEGGATFLFCSADAPAYIWLPDGGSYRLPEEASRALYTTVSRLSLPEEGTIAPVLVTDHLDALALTVTIDPGPSETGLRSVTVASGHRLEPDAVRADGTPIGRSFVVDGAAAGKVVAALANGGFFQRAKVYASEATADAGELPEGRLQGPWPQPAAPAGWVSLTVSDGTWHHTWFEHNAKAIFQHTVSHLGGAVEDEPRSALDSLADQLP